MDTFSLITFLTDYGLSGGYVAACEAVMISLCPSVRVLHVAHDVQAGDIKEGAAVLGRFVPLSPPAVHLAVVDPGVGTDRRGIALRSERGDFLVGPDNGLLLPGCMALGPRFTAWSLDPSLVRKQAGLPASGLSQTFHGRDVFAPAAALLAIGTPPALLGEPVDSTSVAVLPPPFVQIDPPTVLTEITEVDRFGNVALALSFSSFQATRDWQSQGREPNVLVSIRAEEPQQEPWEARVVRTFGELAPGELGVFRDSWGKTALTLNGASAAELLDVRRGDIVELILLPRP